MGVVLVSGANSGIGRATALAFARAGHRVAAGSRVLGRGADLAELAARAGLALEVVALDVTSDRSVADAAAATRARFGPVDVLVNNAGVMAGGPVEHLTDGTLRAVLDTNVLGPLRLVRAVLPDMRRRRQGTVVLVGSLQGRVPAPNAAAYAASKQAAAAVNDALALEVEGFGIRVTCVEIGPYRTGMTTGRRPVDPATEDYGPLLAGLGARSARRLSDAGDPAEVAAAIVALAAHPAPPLRVAVGSHALEYLSGEQVGDRFRRDLRRELGADPPAFTTSTDGPPTTAPEEGAWRRGAP